MLNVHTLGVLGFGNMGAAIVGGLCNRGVLTPKHVYVYDPSQERQETAAALGAAICRNAADVVSCAEAVLLAVKPQQMESALQAARDGLTRSTLFISIAAGISTLWLERRIGPYARVIRAMPNTPALVEASATAICRGATATDDDMTFARALFEALGITVVVEESQMDAVTAVSGSGPAYFFRLVECLAEAGIKQGLPEDVAHSLAAQTLIGAGLLLQKSGESPKTLRERVTSKGGTTEAALRYFSENGFCFLVQGAVQAAAQRAAELALPT